MTLEKTIQQLLTEYPDETTFDVKAFELWRDESGGWSVNDAWYLTRGADKAEVISTARGRWEVFKVNYLPRARVKDITDINYDRETGLSLECDYTAFLDIIPQP